MSTSHAKVAAIAALIALIAGCTDSFPWSVRIPDNLRTPSIAGVVTDSAQLPNGHWQYRLTDGETLEVDYDETESLLGGPDTGRLLLFGVDPAGGQWIAGVSGDWPGRPSGCYLFPAQGRAVDGWIETNSGFRLPKAARFDDRRDNPEDLFTSDRGVFCLNDRGEVTSYDVA
jgi:hypothetical protein